MTCSCYIEELINNDFQISINTVIGCYHGKKAKYFVSSCKECPFNSSLFGGNYFSSISCFCSKTDKNSYCGYCHNLKNHSNYCVKKICIGVYNIDQLPFKVVDFKKFLFDLKADPFLYLMIILKLLMWKLIILIISVFLMI